MLFRSKGRRSWGNGIDFADKLTSGHPNFSYGLNGFYAAQSPTTGSPKKILKFGLIKKPSSRLWVRELGKTWATTAITGTAYGASKADSFPLRHNNMTNVVMADGHFESRSRKQFPVISYIGNIANFRQDPTDFFVDYIDTFSGLPF